MRSFGLKSFRAKVLVRLPCGLKRFEDLPALSFESGSGIELSASIRESVHGRGLPVSRLVEPGRQAPAHPFSRGDPMNKYHRHLCHERPPPISAHDLLPNSTPLPVSPVIAAGARSDTRLNALRPPSLVTAGAPHPLIALTAVAKVVTPSVVATVVPTALTHQNSAIATAATANIFPGDESRFMIGGTTGKVGLGS